MPGIKLSSYCPEFGDNLVLGTSHNNLITWRLAPLLRERDCNMSPVHGKIKKEILIGVLVILALISILINLFDSKVKRTVTVEAGIEALNVSDFIKNKKNSGMFVIDLSENDLSTPGIYDVEIQVGKKVYSSKVEVEDTIAPTGKAINHEIWADERIGAEEFVQNVTDATDVNIYFAEEPDFNKIGSQKVLIILEDTSGNKTQLEALLSIKKDTESPVIIGVQDQTVYVGTKISYRQGVTVTDNRDENIDLKIDSSGVNPKKIGSYEVVYSAVDSAGNTTTETATINVIERPVNIVTEEELNELADRVLANIFKEDMTDIDRLWAIYRWTRTHIVYTGGSDKTNWIKEAARGIQNGRGDCFTYYATSRALLTRAGFGNMVVFRDTDSSFHAWNLVRVGDDWYHFDTTPSRRGHYYICFLRTDEEVLEYSEWCKEYFKFDQTLYPETPLEPLEHPRNL